MKWDVLTSGSPVAKPKSGSDYSAFITKLYFFFQFLYTGKMFLRTPRGTRTRGWRPLAHATFLVVSVSLRYTVCRYGTREPLNGFLRNLVLANLYFYWTIWLGWNLRRRLTFTLGRRAFRMVLILASTTHTRMPFCVEKIVLTLSAYILKPR
jgi:hypothetical protein